MNKRYRGGDVAVTRILQIVGAAILLILFSQQTSLAQTRASQSFCVWHEGQILQVMGFGKCRGCFTVKVWPNGQAFELKRLDLLNAQVDCRQGLVTVPDYHLGGSSGPLVHIFLGSAFESVKDVADQYGVDYDDLKRRNHLGSFAPVRGTKLIIPGTGVMLEQNGVAVSAVGCTRVVHAGEKLDPEGRFTLGVGRKPSCESINCTTTLWLATGPATIEATWGGSTGLDSWIYQEFELPQSGGSWLIRGQASNTPVNDGFCIQWEGFVPTGYKCYEQCGRPATDNPLLQVQPDQALLIPVKPVYSTTSSNRWHTFVCRPLSGRSACQTLISQTYIWPGSEQRYPFNPGTYQWERWQFAPYRSFGPGETIAAEYRPVDLGYSIDARWVVQEIRRGLLKIWEQDVDYEIVPEGMGWQPK